VSGETGGRFWEVDAARGVALLMMVVYHLAYDLDNFGGYAIRSTSGFWALFADVTAFAFVFLVGVSLAISFSREERAGKRGQASFGKYLRRGLRIFAYGMMITLVFWTLDYGVVLFGILHLIGVSIVLAYPFVGLRLVNAFAGLSVIAAGAYLRMNDVAVGGAVGILLAPLGVVPEGLFMPDYRPLLPWFGVVLLGLFAGNVLYAGRSPAKTAADFPRASPARWLGFLGRHSLPIYLLHQPALIAALWALGVLRPGAF
jgi:uncharacterized membrane protein